MAYDVRCALSAYGRKVDALDFGRGLAFRISPETSVSTSNSSTLTGQNLIILTSFEGPN